MISRIVVAGGGTGGHLFPGIAVVEEIRRRYPDVQVVFAGTRRGIEKDVLPRLGERLEFVDVKPLLGRSKLQLARNVAMLPRAGLQAWSLLHKTRPQLVLGLGGYVAGPILMTAALRGIPTALLEQNVHVGFTNRMLSRSIGRAYLTYPETASLFAVERARVLGNPVRRAFVEAAQLAAVDPAGTQARSRRLLVLGGSQGAEALNRLVPEALGELAADPHLEVEVVHQTGASMVDAVSQAYRSRGVDAEVVPFIDDMARAYASSSLVIARAGATTLAELCAIGRPSVLIPFPHAAQDHQAKNARALAAAGAAIVIPESELTAAGLSAEVGALLRDAPRRGRMGQAARSQGRPDAAASIVDDLLEWLGFPTDGSPETDGEVTVAPRSKAPPGSRLKRQTKVRRAQLRIRDLDASIDREAAS